jgi:hypothetical protein
MKILRRPNLIAFSVGIATALFMTASLLSICKVFAVLELQYGVADSLLTPFQVELKILNTFKMIAISLWPQAIEFALAALMFILIEKIEKSESKS